MIHVGHTVGKPAVRRWGPTASRSSIRCPKSFQSARSDGQRWRWCLAQAGEIDPQRLDTATNSVRRLPLEPVRRRDDGRVGMAFRADGNRRHEGRRKRHLRPAHARRRRDDCPAGHGHQAVQAAGRVQLHQDLSAGGTKPRPWAAPPRPTTPRDGRCSAWPKSSRTAGSTPRRPTIGGGCCRSFPTGRPTSASLASSGSTRLSATGAASSRPRPSPPAAAPRSSTASATAGRSSSPPTRSRFEKLLDDVKALLKSNPGRLDWRKINIGDIGYRLVTENQEQYVGRQVAQWQADRRAARGATSTSALPSPRRSNARAPTCSGRKWPAATTSFIVVWVDDTVIVKKPLAGKTYYFVADAATGQPIARANVEFFGWQHGLASTSRRGTKIITRQFAEFTDADGQVIPDPEPPAGRTCSGSSRRGPTKGVSPTSASTNVWYANWYDAEYNATKVYTITDRPVYRPEQKVHYKFWVRHAQYDMGDVSEFANRDFTVEIHNPKGEKIVSAIEADRRLWRHRGRICRPGRCHAGRLWTHARRLRDARPRAEPCGGGSFRVEEYKKPEFEVTVDAPDRAGHAGREDLGHDHGEILLRLAGDPGQGQVHGQSHQL